MFEDSGEKLKTLSVIVFVLNLLLTLVGAILVATRFRSFAFWPLIGVLVGGGVFSYVESLFIYAFGELIDSSADSARNSRYILSVVEKNMAQMKASANASGLSGRTPAAAGPVFTPAAASHAATPAAAAPVPPRNAPVQAPAQPTAPDVPQEKTFVQHLQFAASFQSDSGMMQYLRKAASLTDTVMQPDEISTLQYLSSLPLPNVRPEIQRILAAKGAAV